jgi:hypothetical protein
LRVFIGPVILLIFGAPTHTVFDIVYGVPSTVNDAVIVPELAVEELAALTVTDVPVFPLG